MTYVYECGDTKLFCLTDKFIKIPMGGELLFSMPKKKWDLGGQNL